MNSNLEPVYKCKFDDNWVLWYAKSNSYSIVNDVFKTTLDAYFEAESFITFKAKLASINDTLDPQTVIDNLNSYLENCNIVSNETPPSSVELDINDRTTYRSYFIKKRGVRIYYNSESVLKTIHPSLAHLEIESDDHPQTTFDLYLRHKELFLFKDKQLISRVPQNEYHFMQGKFIMQLLCSLYDKEESDWIGTLHGSTITDGKSSLLFIGASGKGKSTLCSILAHNGYKLLADDVSPLGSDTLSIYHNPAAISIKKGAFNVLHTIVENFEALESIEFNKAKGPLKYIPSPSPEKDQYPCKAIILVNYIEGSKTHLEEVSIKSVLETLIPDSWLSPKPVHAKQFLDWLETLDLYELTYSDPTEMTTKVSQLFK